MVGARCSGVVAAVVLGAALLWRAAAGQAPPVPDGGSAEHAAADNSSEVERLRADLTALEERVRRLESLLQVAAGEERGAELEIPLYDPRLDSHDPRPAAVQLEQKLSDIAREVERLRATGEAAEADRVEAAWNDLRGRLSGPYPGSTSEEPQLHVVGISMGAGDGGGNEFDATNVRLTYAGRPVVLALLSHEPVRWHLELAEGVELVKVLVGGERRQEVVGVPDGTVVEERFHREGAEGALRSTYGPEADGYRFAMQLLRDATGLEVATFQGAHNYRDPFVVGPESADWRTQHVLADVAELHGRTMQAQIALRRAQLAQWKFQAAHYTFGGRFHEVSGAFGDFTPLGPVAGTLTALPRRIDHFVVDPQGPMIYGIRSHGLVRFDPQADMDSGTEIEIPAPLPELSWPSGIAFDAKRRRVLIASFGGVGYLYSYEPDDDRWTVLADMDERGFAAMVHDPERDLIYGLDLAMQEHEALDVLFKLNPQGALLDSIPIVPPIPGGGRDSRRQAVYSHGRIVVLVHGATRGPNGESAGDSLSACYVLDPESGRVTFSTPMEEP